MKAFRAERLLARAFFGRFFESDLMPPGLPQVQLVIWSIALLAAPGFMLSFQLEKKYARLWRTSRGALADSILVDQLLFVTFGMTALGLVALVIWEGVFPDRRDARVLGVLPLRTRTHVIGRLAALGAVAALFAIGVNVLTAAAYGPAAMAHIIAAGLGGLFVFFTLIAAQGVLLNLFGRRVAQRLALVLQMLFVILLVQALFFVPYLGVSVREAFHAGESRGGWLPPAWFLALYDVLAGSPREVPATYAAAALLAAVGAAAIATALLAGSYRRLARMALETLDGWHGLRARLGASAAAMLARVAARSPVQRAVASFTIHTLSRSRAHLMLLAMYVGVAAALVLAGLIPLLARRGLSWIDVPRVAVLSAPLVLNFAALCGMRVLFGIPTEIKANWAFRLHAPEDRLPGAIAGVRTALLAAVIPIAGAAGIVGTWLWGLRTGAIHALFTAAAGVLLADLLLVGLRKIPFSCTYYPGRSRARTFWPLYGIAFGTYAYTLAEIELEVIHRPILLGIFLAIVAAACVVLSELRRRDLRPPPGLKYQEEDPDAIFEGFKLSEGLAAETPGMPFRH